MADIITLYEENTLSIQCTVTGLDDLDGYTATLTVKSRADDTTAVLTKEGSISSLVITFDLTATDTDIAPAQYTYDITIDDGTNQYTLVQNIFYVKDSVKF